MIADVRRIMEKRAANRAVMPEEFNLLAKFADLVQRRLITARDAARQARLKEIEAVRMTLPQGAFQMPRHGARTAGQHHSKRCSRSRTSARLCCVS